ncbi:hypothetical protein HW932_00260 [Allochromatium humboldtianum]|uniref:DUF1640 domain-containing protein n=1 Tax=Allochromatium humboldtianum TaxID=504901 RepID=A0A850R9P7_9GAMM|nr:hypothetical protein [Allochromatium humboldtianum]NVZ07690.1 hypothetical protein [Allochromatium humboldtianum]
MTTFVLDTLAYAETLKAGGFNEQQAATKAEVEAHENNLRRDIEALRLETKRDIAEAKSELIRWVVGAGFLQTTLIIGALMKMGGLV